ncbi:hypothetical protein EVA_15939 [gut metagenome]|uniref:DUF3168 domain-containing protein n=1 Tax=gut metagenome TaxID=749906 RepID=J9FNB9_9ZZZZ
MALTAKQVQGDVYRMLRDSSLRKAITGGIYREGMRPRGSQTEDAIVIFSSGLAEEVQSGVVTIQLYSPDIAPWGNGVWVEDAARTEQLEQMAQQWVDSLTAQKSCYLFRLQQTIYTETDDEIHQHFVVVKLAYRYFNN